MITILLPITLIVATGYYLKSIAGKELLTAPICLMLEMASNYRVPDFNQGFYNRPESDVFASTLSQFFTAISNINLTCDEYGWQTAIFEIIPTSSGISEDMIPAISVSVRNFIKKKHGYDNPDIYVPVLCESVMFIKIACSPKAHEQVKKLDFSTGPQNFRAPEEEIF